VTKCLGPVRWPAAATTGHPWGVTTLSDLVLDRSSPVPLYFQVARQIEAAIEGGTLPPGHRLETEVQLAERLGLSRPTLRQALQELVDKGLLVRRRGVGTQVVRTGIKRPVRLSSLYDDLLAGGRRPTTVVLIHQIVPADLHVAEHLAVPEGTDVVHLRRQRLADGQPIALMTNWLPADIAPWSTNELEATGLYELLRAAGVRICVASQRIGARLATASHGRLLAERKGAALLTMERVGYDNSGRAVEYGSHLYGAGTYSFELTLVAPNVS